MQIGRKAQGQDMTCGEAGTKKIADGMGHTASRTKWVVRRRLERKVRQAGRKVCRAEG